MPEIQCNFKPKNYASTCMCVIISEYITLKTINKQMIFNKLDDKI